MGTRRRIRVVTTEFAEAAERHLDDVHAYLVYLTGDRGTAAGQRADVALPARALDGARPLPRGGAAPSPGGPLRGSLGRDRGAGLRRRSVPGAGGGPGAPLCRRAGGGRAADRA